MLQCIDVASNVYKKRLKKLEEDSTDENAD